jgi:hypothetical protein
MAVTCILRLTNRNSSSISDCGEPSLYDVQTLVQFILRDVQRRRETQSVAVDAAAEKEEVTPGEIRFLLNPSFALEEQTRVRMGALTEIREKLLGRRRTIGFVFAGIEADTITIAELQERLGRAGLILSKPQIEVLSVYYRKGDGLFDWKTFRDDCEASAIVGTRM